MPLEEDIGKAYAQYYTHAAVPPNAFKKGNGKLLLWLLHSVHDLLLGVTSIQRERRRLSLMYLDGVSPGRVLDVGCGDGARLARLRSLGWDVTGQEMDPEAALRARQTYGIHVHLGPLNEAEFKVGEFDAIIMNHVIEHVYDPVRLLADCNRLLRKGGTLVVVTPNAESCGHERFGSSWRGLEPPRHLYLFNQSTLLEVARRAGFSGLDVCTTPANAEALASGSVGIRSGENKPLDLGRKLKQGVLSCQYQLRWQLVYRKDKNSGEECVLKAMC